MKESSRHGATPLPASCLPLLILLVSTGARAQGTIREDSLYANSLGRRMYVNVFLPAGYSDTSHDPVLYLLHGYGGSHRDWLAATQLANVAADLPLIIVMPDADNSWYVNSLSDRQRRFEDYITADLPAFIRKHYSVDTSWQAIAGLSMGGYGALILALRHHDRFAFAGVMSGSLDIPWGIDSLEAGGRGYLRPSLEQAFGRYRSTFRDSLDPYVLLHRIRPDSLPYMYLVTGIDESFRGRLLLHRRFADTLRAEGASYEYHETPGRHDFAFWGREIGPLLRRMLETGLRGYRSGAALLYRALMTNGAAEASRRFHGLRKQRPVRYYLDDGELAAAGSAILDAGKPADAVAYLTMGLEAFPQSGRMYARLGKAYIAFGDTAAGVARLRKALTLEPDLTEARTLLGKLDAK